ncbi:MAG: RHS repeat domain-containing protein [Bacteroidales bacterium]|nr:RHS repeat domain-containing protein [Bacteroidales bacterium]
MKIKAFFFAAALAIAPSVAVQASPAHQVEVFSKAQKAAHTKQMQRVFALLGKGQYAQAWQEQLALEKLMAPDHAAYERALYPLYDLSNAMFMVCPKGQGVAMQPDAWAAEQLVRNIYVRGTGIEEANAFLGADDIMLSVDMIRSMVEKRLIEHVNATGTADAYRQLLAVIDNTHPAYKHASDQVAILEFEETCNSAAGCRNYLRNYPNSPLIDKAKEKLLKYDFAHAKEVNDEKTWNKFISDYQFVNTAATQVADARKALVVLQEMRLCSASVALADLDKYASSHRRDVANRVFITYDNLINLPTHSYRFMSLKLNFNGAVGKVEETITETNGTVTLNRYTFNAQGLLTEAYNGHARVLTQYTYGYDERRGFYPVSKTEKGKTYTYKCIYGTNGRLSRITCTDGQVIDYTYDADGRITERNETTADGKKRNSTFKSGKIRTEKTGDTMLRFLRYDGSRATQINSEKANAKHMWTYTYTTNEAGQWTTAEAQLDGKPRMTITRTFAQ